LVESGVDFRDIKRAKVLELGSGLRLKGFKPLGFSLDEFFGGGEGKAGAGLGGK
jgi:hypothetical protein